MGLRHTGPLLLLPPPSPPLFPAPAPPITFLHLSSEAVCAAGRAQLRAALVGSVCVGAQSLRGVRSCSLTSRSSTRKAPLAMQRRCLKRRTEPRVGG
eukprot:930940-Rhodomonas_salina.1